jgi:Sec-independent protein translocase protein TatA
MDILGIGPLELLFILVIALIVLGPSDMVKAGRTIGRFLRQIVTSPTWRAVTQTSNEIRRIPNRLIREAGLETEMDTLKSLSKQTEIPQNDLEEWRNQISPWTTPPSGAGPQEEAAKNKTVEHNQDSSASEDQT